MRRWEGMISSSQREPAAAHLGEDLFSFLPPWSPLKPEAEDQACLSDASLQRQGSIYAWKLEAVFRPAAQSSAEAPPSRAL